MTRFAPINLSKFEKPTLIQQLDVEQIVDAMLDDYQKYFGDNGLAEVRIQGDPANRVLLVAAYREKLMREEFQEASWQTMLPFATGKNLDIIGARYGVVRQMLDPGDPTATPPIAPVMEEDDIFRLRIQLAPEAMTTAGSTASYRFNAISTGEEPATIDIDQPEPGVVVLTYRFDPNGYAAKIKSVEVVSPDPGVVDVIILGWDGNGVVSNEIKAAVEKHICGLYVRPFTDNTHVKKATIVNYKITATVHLFDGPDASLIETEARKRLDAYVAERHRLGAEVTTSGIKKALQVEGVNKVLIADNWQDIATDKYHAPFCNEPYDLTFLKAAS